jgi:hypothetical protein
MIDKAHPVDGDASARKLPERETPPAERVLHRGRFHRRDRRRRTLPQG